MPHSNDISTGQPVDGPGSISGGMDAWAVSIPTDSDVAVIAGCLFIQYALSIASNALNLH